MCWTIVRCLLYAVTQSTPRPCALSDDPLAVVVPSDAQLLMTLRATPSGATAAAIKGLRFVPGASAGARGQDSLLVCGGQGAGEPDMLSLLPLAPQAPGAERGQTLPWFGDIQGYALVAAGAGAGALGLDHTTASGEAAAAVMILTEGGQLVVHDLASWTPQPLTLPLMELPPITVARLAPTVSLALMAEMCGGSSAAPSPRDVAALSPRDLAASRQGSVGGPGVQHALTMDKLRACSRRHFGAPAAAAAAAAEEAAMAEHWPFRGGVPPACASGQEDMRTGAGRHPSALYLSGHRDGRVRVWDATSASPLLLATIPAAAGQERLRPVTTLDVCPFSGLVLVGGGSGVGARQLPRAWDSPLSTQAAGVDAAGCCPAPLQVGHAGGDVRLYQFADSAQNVHRMNLDESRVAYETVSPQVGRT